MKANSAATCFILAFVLLAGCCVETEVRCFTGSVEPQFVGFRLEDLDTFFVTVAPADSLGLAVTRRDTVVLDSSEFALADGTFSIRRGFIVVQFGSDYEFAFPSINRSFRITNVRPDGPPTRVLKECFGREESCWEPISSCLVNDTVNVVETDNRGFGPLLLRR